MKVKTLVTITLAIFVIGYLGIIAAGLLSHPNNANVQGIQAVTPSKSGSSTPALSDIQTAPVNITQPPASAEPAVSPAPAPVIYKPPVDTGRRSMAS